MDTWRKRGRETAGHVEENKDLNGWTRGGKQGGKRVDTWRKRGRETAGHVEENKEGKGWTRGEHNCEICKQIETGRNKRIGRTRKKMWRLVGCIDVERCNGEQQET